MLLSKQDTEFFIDTGAFENAITDITHRDNTNFSLEYCDGYNAAINNFIFTFKKQYKPIIKHKITNLIKRMQKGEIRYFVSETNPYRWSKVGNSLLSNAMCDVLCLIYFDMCALKKSEYREGYHQAIIDIATYCGLREL